MKKKTEAYAKTQETTKIILMNYYQEVVAKLNKMHKRKTKPSQKQMLKQFAKISEKYAQAMELHLGKLEMIEFNFKSPKGWESSKPARKNKN